MIEFTDDNIQKLFGHEAAEDEDPERLKKYYFKSSIYDRIATDLPIRILVGHKGIGKSALFKIAKDQLPFTFFKTTCAVVPARQTEAKLNTAHR
ncbi:MAG: hypothetical protein H0X72_18760 [Acidobacteria bacterium]|jgi:hypothetical protein|nr:hypothetical protein [Acidobacteriota bacterium]